MNLITNIAVFRAMRFIKKNNENAFKIGREFCSLFYIIYSEFKKNHLYPSDMIWESFKQMEGFNNLIISNFIGPRLDYPMFFSKCNLKILQMKASRLSSFFRGYYINDINLFSTNITTNSMDKFIVLYDSHYHYLLFLYNYLSSKGTSINLNDQADQYSINEDSDAMCYKLIFEKKNYDFIDPIKNLLNFLYTSVDSNYDCMGDDDRILFNRYLAYCSYN